MNEIIVYHGGTEQIEKPICCLGLIDLQSALKELSKHQPNNQICILNQELLEKYLIYDGTEEI